MSAPYAKLRVRFVATAMNLFLIVACLSPLIYLMNTFLQPSHHQVVLYAVYSMVRSLLVFVSAVVSMAWLTHRFGCSPGKCLLGLKVLNEKDNSHLNMAQAITRTVLALISTATVIGVLYMWFDPKRRTLHDRLMRTVVIEHEDDYAEIDVSAEQLASLLHDQ